MKGEKKGIVLMARGIHKLTALAVNKTTKTGLHSDGGGLYLQVTTTGAKSWVFRFMLQGKSHMMGLGALHSVTLQQAREKAQTCRSQIQQGKNPLKEKQQAKQQAMLEAARDITFEQCAEAYIEAHKEGWKNAKHLSQWKATLSTYAYPFIGKLSVAEIDTPLVLKCLEPIWKEKTETATRLRGRIESILDWAKVRGYRTGENPAAWRGHLDKLLPAPAKIAKVQHQAAMPYRQLPAFMAQLQQKESHSALALAFTILTACRTGEVLGARWEEIDMAEATWTIPAGRMKAGREHRVPLSRQAMAILKKLQAESFGSPYLFHNADPVKPLSNMALLMLLRRMEVEAVTHGFRSTFRDWAAETTAYPNEVAEMALAHMVNNKVEAAYRRGDLFDKRRRLMQDWADYSYSPPIATVGSSTQMDDKVVGIRHQIKRG